MAHKFTGQWRAFIFPDGASKAKKDGELDLNLDDSGNIQMGSNHDGKPVTGKAEETGGNHHLTVNQEEPGNRREHTGILFSEEDTKGQTSMVIIGRYKDIETPLEPGAKDKEWKPGPRPGPPPAQDEGIWVVTKP